MLARQTGLSRGQVTNVLLEGYLFLFIVSFILLNVMFFCMFVKGFKLVYKCSCAFMEANGGGDIQGGIHRE